MLKCFDHSLNIHLKVNRKIIKTNLIIRMLDHKEGQPEGEILKTIL